MREWRSRIPAASSRKHAFTAFRASPCGENTEWTETIDVGANRLVGCDPERIAAGVEAALTGPRGWEVPFGDGRAAAHIAPIGVEKHLRGDSVGVEMLD